MNKSLFILLITTINILLNFLLYFSFYDYSFPLISGDYRFIWEVFMTFVYAISFFTIPFMTSFIVLDYDAVQLDKLSLILYIIFFLDIYINTITGVWQKSTGMISFNQNIIFK